MYIIHSIFEFEIHQGPKSDYRREQVTNAQLKKAMREEEYNIDTCSIRCWKNIDERDKHIEHKQKTKRAETDAYYVLKKRSVHTGEEGRAWGKCKTDDNYHRYAAKKNGAVPNLSQTRQDKDARDVNQGNKGKASE